MNGRTHGHGRFPLGIKLSSLLVVKNPEKKPGARQLVRESGPSEAAPLGRMVRPTP